MFTKQYHNDTNDSKLQQAVADLVNLARMNDMTIHATKTKRNGIVIQQSGPRYPWHCCGRYNTRESVDTVKLLSVHQANDLTWVHHIAFIVFKKGPKQVVFV